VKKLLLVFFSIVALHSYASEKCILTLPKSGTYLLKKIFNDLMKTEIHVSHVLKGPGMNTPQERYVVSMRDPRDYFVSMKNFKTFVSRESLKKGVSWPGMVFDYKAYLNLSEDEKLLELLLNSNYPLDAVSKLFQAVSQAQQDPLALIIRFEDFVGKNGGGNNKLQKDTILEVLEWLGVHVHRNRVQYALSHAWGGSVTFHKGLIGQWKQEFKPVHVKIFKEYWNQYLIDWGYETDWDWDIYYFIEN